MNNENQSKSATPAKNVQPDDRGKITYQVAGQDVTLSYQIVRNYLTRGNGQVSDQDLVQFISICKFNQLNPFLNEAYLVKFGTQPAQMIVSKEALMKRAEACDQYDGMKAGVIVKRGNDVIEEEGSFLMPNDVLLGGWAQVYRKDRKFPYVSKVSLSEYDKKQSTWNEKKSTMIRKTAIVQALREAFPAQLGSMYTAEESSVQDVDYEDVTEKVNREKAENANKATIGFEPSAPAQSNESGMTVDTETGEIKEETKKQDKPEGSIQQQRKMPGF